MVLTLVAAGWHVGNGLKLLDDLGGRTDGDGKGGDVFGDDTAGAYGTAVPNGDAGHDGDVAADPAVVANGNGLCVLDDWTSVSWVAAKMETLGPKRTLWPMVTMPQSRMTRLFGLPRSAREIRCCRW